MTELLELPNDKWLRATHMPEYSVCLDSDARYFGWKMKQINGSWVSVGKMTLEETRRLYHDERFAGHKQRLGELIDWIIDGA